MNVEQQQGELAAISRDMRKAYDEFRSHALKREDADTLANLAGKNIKCMQLLLAHALRGDGLLSLAGKQPKKLK